LSKKAAQLYQFKAAYPFVKDGCPAVTALFSCVTTLSQTVFFLSPAAYIRLYCCSFNYFFINQELNSLVAWKEVCLAKSEGALGFKDIRSWNSALLAKALWNIQQKKDSLWVRLVNHEYMRSVSIWEWPSKKDDSPPIKKILAIRESIPLSEGSVPAASQKLSSWDQGGNIYKRLMISFGPKVPKRFGLQMFGALVLLLSMPLSFG